MGDIYDIGGEVLRKSHSTYKNSDLNVCGVGALESRDEDCDAMKSGQSPVGFKCTVLFERKLMKR